MRCTFMQNMSLVIKLVVREVREKYQVFTLSLCRQTGVQMEGLADRRSMVKQYAPDLLMRGHKNSKVVSLMHTIITNKILGIIYPV